MTDDPNDTLSVAVQSALDAVSARIDAVARRGPVIRIFADKLHEHQRYAVMMSSRREEENI